MLPFFMLLLWTIVCGLSVLAEVTQPKDLGSTLASHQELSTFYGLIQQHPNFLLQLPNYDGVTIVAPTNKAFTNIPGTSLNGIWNPNRSEIVEPILDYHVLTGTVASGAIFAENGTLAATLLVDAAWTNVSLGQHVFIYKQPNRGLVFVSGDGNRETVTESEITFEGGLIQVVDNLLVPPSRLNHTLTQYELLSFLGALYACDVYEIFAEAPNCTFFVPVNEAFETINGTLSALPAAALAQVLKYHQVPHQVLPSAALVNGTSLNTSAALEGGGVGGVGGGAPAPLLVHRVGNNLYVDSAQVVQPDILVANGILHIIDNVLNPNASGAQPDPALGTQAAVYANATAPASTATTTELPFTSALPCSVSCPVPAVSVTSSSTRPSRTSGTSSSSSRGGGGVSRPTAVGTRAMGAAVCLVGLAMAY